ncbi:hypothetical protein [Pseudomonas sp. NPDC089734]|uniref:hypothetical protein n=1 Tax=Pseudomonas sp. NPDC089734 TaxID=3364469 RepID=UPI0038259727
MTYNNFVKKTLPAFTSSRLTPLLGISLLFSLTAHKAPDDLVTISYVLALFSIVSTIAPMLIATSGNTTSSLIDDEAAKRNFFTGGFTTTLCLASASTILSIMVLFIALTLPGMRNVHTPAFVSLSLIYLPAIPLLSINFFLQLFHEADKRHSNYSKIKTGTTFLGAIFLLTAFAYSPRNAFKYYAMSYFLLTEALLFIYLIKLSTGYRFISTRHAQKIASDLLKKGGPLASGVAGQKIYFYLMVERLTTTNPDLTIQLSIFMSIINIISTPSQAFSQIHSLHTSQQPTKSKYNYHHGILWTTGISSALAGLLYITGNHFFITYSNNTLHLTSSLYLTTVFFLTGNAFLALTMAHLRARNDTLTPQIIVNILMLTTATPVIYTLSWDKHEFFTLIIIQGTALFLSALILHNRISALHNRDKIACLKKT